MIIKIQKHKNVYNEVQNYINDSKTFDKPLI